MEPENQPTAPQPSGNESGLTGGGAGLDDESGLTGGGAGLDDDAGLTGVSPVSANADPSGDAPAQSEEAWGQGRHGAAGYQDSGGSGLEANGEADTQPGTPPRIMMP